MDNRSEVFGKDFSVKATKIIAMGLFGACVGWGQLCEKDFYLQSVHQTTLEGPTIAGLEVKSQKDLKPSGSDMQPLHLAMAYKFMVAFEGQCASAKSEITYLEKAVGAGSYTTKTETNHFLRLYDSTTIIEGMNYDYWFGFSAPEDSLRFVLAHEKDDPEPGFSNYYAAALFTDSTRNETSGLWTVNYRFFHLAGPLDSLTLATQFMKGSGWNDLEFGANHKGWFNFQFLRVVYDTLVPAPIAKNSKLRGIRMLEGSHGLRIDAPALAQSGAILDVHDMSGRRVAYLHPQARGYVWNGKSQGSRPGVYLLMHSGEALGKFLVKP
jgi:hypothetical protein